MKKTTKPVKTAIKQLVRTSDLQQIIGGGDITQWVSDTRTGKNTR